MKKIINYLLIFTIATIGIACSDFVGGVSNENPNLPLKADATNTFQGILVGTQFSQADELARRSGIWIGYFTGQDRQYLGYNNWNNSVAADFDSDWGNIFAGVITNAQLTKSQAIVENKQTLAGATEVIEAYMFGTATSLWGDIPFSQVNKLDEFPNPTYDSQVNVYAGVQALLDSAIVKLSSGVGDIDADKDIFYAGDVNKWIKLAYALKARFYLHVSDYVKASLNAKKAFSSAGDELIAPFGSSYGQTFNPYYSFMVYDRGGYMGAQDSYAARLLDPNSDIYRGNSKTNEEGRFNYTYSVGSAGYNVNYTNNFDGWGSQGKFGLELPLVTYGEMLLIIAENDLRTNGFEAGLQSYNRYRQLLNTGYGIGASYTNLAHIYEPYTAEDFASGGMVNVGNLSKEQALLKELYSERYVAFVGSIEGFTDIRRTNNVAGVVMRSGIDGFPERFLYPQNEVNSNSNAPKVVAVTEPTPIHK